MENTKLQEVIQTLQGLKEQANVAMQLLDDSIAVKLENTELSEIQSKINPDHMNIFHAYISYSEDKSYVDIDEKLFTEWWTQYESKNEEEYTKAFLSSDIMSEIHHDMMQYKKDGYKPHGTYYSEYLEIELEMSKQSYPSDAEAMACFYDAIYVNEDGSLDYLLSCEVMEDTHVQKITYMILPEDKRDLSMVKDTDYIEITKEVFLKELENIDRRFDSLSYKIEKLQSDEELQELARKMRKH